MRRLLLPVACLLLASASAWARNIDADLIVHRIEITSGFSGAELTLFGAIEGKGDVIAVVHGPSAPGGDLLGGTVEVRKKVQSLGIWVSGPYVRFSAVPGFYAVAGSLPLDEIVSAETRTRYQLGIDELNPAAVAATAPDISEYSAALLRIRQRQGLYVAQPGHISFVGDRLFRTSFSFPSNVPTGIYTVDVYLARGGQIVDRQTFPLLVNRAGFSADVYDFAHRHAAAYGIMAVAVALFFGWMAHLAFRRR
jgi:uncharacterized protein (TIGR02186 family)